MIGARFTSVARDSEIVEAKLIRTSVGEVPVVFDVNAKSAIMCPGETMKLVTAIDAEKLEKAVLIAESGEFAIFDVDGDTYALVHRHAAVEWRAITISGDGLFRMAELFSQATRRLYREVASEFSKRHH
jgi:hypothetical protein